MKIPRSVHRRTFHIEPAGDFNVLRPGARFIPAHLRRVFPYLVRQTKEQDPGHAGSVETPDFLPQPQRIDARRTVRWVLIVVAAIAITLGWLYGSPMPWRHIGPWPH